MGTTSDEMVSVEHTSSSSYNPLCFECGQQHWTRENHLYNYQAEVDDDLVCHICLQPLLQPLDTPCGHTFCCKCLRNFLQEKDFCPLDRKRLHFKLCKKSSILVHKLLDKLLVLCPFSSVCQDVMQRCDLEAHLKNRKPPDAPFLDVPELLSRELPLRGGKLVKLRQSLRVKMEPP